MKLLHPDGSPEYRSGAKRERAAGEPVGFAAWVEALVEVDWRAGARPPSTRKRPELAGLTGAVDGADVAGVMAPLQVMESSLRLSWSRLLS